MPSINPYLNFEGQAEAAFRFYQSVFGGELFMQRMQDMPGTENLSEEEKAYMMHIALPIGQNILMASDCLASMGHHVNQGNHSYISVNADSRDEATRLFEALSAGGQVEMPMEDMFWGDYFGSFTDRFGIKWMISYNTRTS